MSAEPSAERIDAHYEKLKREAEAGGYRLNPDVAFTKDLMRGLLINEDRYGYGACPCRLAAGVKAEDLGIICPCDYRDPDLSQYGACYCALYVSLPIYKGEEQAQSIPERRPPPAERKKKASSTGSPTGSTGSTSSPTGGLANLPYPVYRCKVCGYLCARDEPPEVCPVCKAKKERFERFL